MENEKVEIQTPKEELNWEIKDRTYYLSRGKKPLTATIPSTNIYYFDEEKGYERELKYTSNQRTCFVDEMVGDQRLEHITFMNGFLPPFNLYNLSFISHSFFGLTLSLGCSTTGTVSTTVST